MATVRGLGGFCYPNPFPGTAHGTSAGSWNPPTENGHARRLRQKFVGGVPARKIGSSARAGLLRQLSTRNLHFAVRPVPKFSDGEAFEEGICLNYFFSLGSTRCVGSRHNEGGAGILHC